MADINDANMQSSGGGGARPDPTALTTEALRREVAGLKELIDQRITALQLLTDSNMAGIAIQFQDMKELRNEKVECLKDELGRAEQLRDEKFVGVAERMEMLEQYRIEQKSDTKSAVDAALQAAKEAVHEQTIASDRSITKSETATNEQIKGVVTQVTDLKDRLTVLESLRLGGKESNSSMIAVIGVLIALSVFALGLATYLGR